jgi:hypothetical protein
MHICVCAYPQELVSDAVRWLQSPTKPSETKDSAQKAVPGYIDQLWAQHRFCRAQRVLQRERKRRAEREAALAQAQTKAAGGGGGGADGKSAASAAEESEKVVPVPGGVSDAVPAADAPPPAYQPPDAATAAQAQAQAVAEAEAALKAQAELDAANDAVEDAAVDDNALMSLDPVPGQDGSFGSCRGGWLLVRRAPVCARAMCCVVRQSGCDVSFA